MRYGLMGSTAAILLAVTAYAQAADQLEAPVETSTSFFGGEWSLTIGAAALAIPEFEGSKDYRFFAQPLVSFGRKGTEQRFTSRNDNISIAIIDTGNFRAGPTGKLVFGRDSDDYDDIEGLSDVDFGVEVGGFAEFYPTEWIRFRGEVRQAIGAHEGLVADGAIDAFAYLTPALRISGGPRITYGNEKYFDAYYGVDFSEAAVSGLSPYSPDEGVASYGVGGALTWKTTDRIETSLFGEYRRLAGPAEDSSIVQERGDKNQFTVGVSATYRFDFAL
ncbi:MipA/OmpV family protein [Tianweitania sp.]|uniref:MipA/OmpV family protein n=1 Tax=Tianweitania sp. TaxID=2021634 RepID=UPI00289BDA35|nr:MipA/OmpV family protein [Tianweitania sp.]